MARLKFTHSETMYPGTEDEYVQDQYCYVDEDEKVFLCDRGGNMLCIAVPAKNILVGDKIFPHYHLITEKHIPLSSITPMTVTSKEII